MSKARNPGKSAPKRPNKTPGSVESPRKARVKPTETQPAALDTVLAAPPRPTAEGPCIVGIGASAGGFDPIKTLNEELNTVNQQLLGKVNELETANNDLRNLLAASEVATLCLDQTLQIKWFSPAARNVLGFIASDVGRPVSVFGTALMGERMISDVQEVLEKLAPVQVEVEAEGNRWYLRRTLPYRTDDKRVEGVIITFTDITDSKREAEARARVEAGKLEAAALERSVEERTKQLRELGFELARTEESERQAIARDLHDDLGQLLAVARVKLTKLRDGDGLGNGAQVVAEVDDLIARAENSIRSLAFQLSPAVLYELGLIPALGWLAEEMKKTYGLSVEVSDDARKKPLSQAARGVLFRAIRELLINVIRHAGVTKAYVGAVRLGEEIEVTVTDDGNGFDLNAMSPRSQIGFGLTSVRERLSFIGGNVEILSVPGDGTEVILKAPLQMQEQSLEDAAESTSRGKNA